MLAADPLHRAPTWWEALYPSPPPEVETYETDPRREKVRSEFAAMIERSPKLLSALPYAPDLIVIDVSFISLTKVLQDGFSNTTLNPTASR